jgi:hypothetical protein
MKQFPKDNDVRETGSYGVVGFGIFEIGATASVGGWRVRILRNRLTRAPFALPANDADANEFSHETRRFRCFSIQSKCFRSIGPRSSTRPPPASRQPGCANVLRSVRLLDIGRQRGLAPCVDRELRGRQWPTEQVALADPNPSAARKSAWTWVSIPSATTRRPRAIAAAAMPQAPRSAGSSAMQVRSILAFCAQPLEKVNISNS